MSASEIQLKCDARAAFAITLASLASLVGRQSAMITNTNKRPAALVSVSLKSGTAPTAGGKYKIYLLRTMSSAADDNVGDVDAAYVRENAPLLGELVVTNSGNKLFTAIFDTWNLGPLGESWGIGIVNETDQALNAADSVASYQTYVPEAQ